jgi:predicted secreted protein
MAAKTGLGMTLAYESATPGTYTAIGELYDVEGNEITVETVDVTNHSHTDGYRRFIAAMIDGGEISATLAFDPALTVYAALKTIIETRAAKNWKVTYPGGSNTIASGLLIALGRATPMDDRMECSIGIKISGQPAEAAS